MRNVLIAEDEEVLSKVLKERFEDEGWDVLTADNGEDALVKLNKAGRDGFDLLILDLLMPKKDGFKCLEEIKGNAELVDLPIIVLSNLGSDEDIKKAMKLGADDYYVKSQHPMSEIVEKAEKFAAGGHTLNKRLNNNQIEKETVVKSTTNKANQELIDFIKESRQMGSEDQETIDKLKENGWQEDDINEAFRILGN